MSSDETMYGMAGPSVYVGPIVTYDTARRLLPATPDHQVLAGKDGREICPIPVRSMAGTGGRRWKWCCMRSCMCTFILWSIIWPWHVNCYWTLRNYRWIHACCINCSSSGCLYSLGAYFHMGAYTCTWEAVVRNRYGCLIHGVPIFMGFLFSMGAYYPKYTVLVLFM